MSDQTVGDRPTGEQSVTDQPTLPRGGLVSDNWLVIGLFGTLTIVGVVLAARLIQTGFVSVPGEEPAGVVIPLYLYLYSTLGALGYVFTKLMSDLRAYDDHSELADLIEMGMRIPAAWILATGFYLVMVQAGTASAAETPYLLSTVAFLVGLYVNVAIKSLGSLADRMLGRGKGYKSEGKG